MVIVLKLLIISSVFFKVFPIEKLKEEINNIYKKPNMNKQNNKYMSKSHVSNSVVDGIANKNIKKSYS